MVSAQAVKWLHRFYGVKAPNLSLRGGQRPTWRPEREARGSALGVQSREGSYVFAGLSCYPTGYCEIATAPLGPRNDNSGVHTILAMACTDRQHCAGPGCPLPCNLTTKNACCSCSRRSFYLLRDFVLCSYWRQPAMRLSESDMNCFSFSSKVCGPLGALS